MNKNYYVYTLNFYIKNISIYLKPISLKKKLLIVTILLIIFATNSYGQSLRIINVNSSDFPTIKADIVAYDTYYNSNQLINSSVTITENNQLLNDYDFTAPKSSVLPTSIVLVIDISASMSGYKFRILKKTVKDFIQNLPLESSELAIASFNQQITLNCDFTHNISRLNNCIDDLRVDGSTDFNSAFLTPYSGAIDIANQGQFKKIIIFITDGLSKLNLNEVGGRAIKDSLQISCLTIDLPISDELKYLAEGTGGNFYSNLKYDYEIKEAFERIYNNIQINTLGKIKWTVPYSCTAHKKTLITIGSERFTIEYQIPDSLIGTIETTPSSINFSKSNINQTTYKPMFVRGNNIDLNITSITNSIDSLFRCTNTIFPIKTIANEWKQLQMSFTPNDSIFTVSQYIIKNTGCPDIFIDASTGGVKKLTITNPLANEVFASGSTIPIEWKGINRSTSVNFLYQIKGQSNWIPFGTATQFKKKWDAPTLNNEIRIQGQVTNNITFSNLVNSTSAIIDLSEFKSAYFNNNGSRILSISTKGEIKSWNSESSELHLQFEKKYIGDIAYYPKFNRVVSISNNTIGIFTNRNGLFVKSISLKEKKTITSYIHINDKEFYTSALDYSGNFWDPSLNHTIDNLPGSKYLDAAITPNGEYIIGRKASSINVIKRNPLKRWFSIKLKNDFNRAILHQTKDVVIIANTNSTDLYNLNSKKIIKFYNNEIFYQYSESGLHLFTNDNNYIYLNNVTTGVRLFSIPSNNTFTLSKNGKYIAYINSDTLTISDIIDHQKLYINTYEKPQKIQFFPKTNKLLIIHNDSLSIINFDTKRTEISVFAENEIIKMIDIAPNEKSLLITTSMAIANWEIRTHFDSDTTPFFSIIIPEPAIAKSISFAKQYINTPTEKVFQNIITNPNKYPLIIDSIYINDTDTNFTLISTPVQQYLMPNKNLPLEIKFIPKSTGSLTAKLVVVSANKKYYCSLNGIGINRDFLLPTPIVQFEALNLFEHTDTLIPLIVNTGSEPLVINEQKLNTNSINAFKVSHIKLPSTLFANDTLWAKTTFKPINRGRQNSIMSIKLDSQNWIKATELIGTAKSKRIVIIAGKTVNSDDNKPLPSQILVTELRSGRIVIKKMTDSNGQFSINLNTDLNYSITAQLDGFFSSSENVNLELPQLVDTIWVEIKLTPIGKNETVRLNNIFFESSKSELLDLSKTELMRIVRLMNSNQNLFIEIHGHTDNIGTDKSNLSLSKARAKAVKNFLVNNGISGNRLSIKYFGETEPIDNNNTLSGRKANRRVEIKFIND